MVRFGIIGFGLHAAKRLMPGFGQAQNARVTALSRRDAERARASAQEYGIAHAFTSADELCHSPEVDAVEGRAGFPVPGEEGWKNQVILDAAYRSMKRRAGGSFSIG